jgi:hypothetical protein
MDGLDEMDTGSVHFVHNVHAVHNYCADSVIAGSATGVSSGLRRRKR